MGLIVCILIPAILFLFGVLAIAQAVSGVLLLAGLWSVTYGVAFARMRDRLYDVGAGVIVIAISAFIFVSPEYVLGLILIAVLAIVIVSVALNRNRP